MNKLHHMREAELRFRNKYSSTDFKTGRLPWVSQVGPKPSQESLKVDETIKERAREMVVLKDPGQCCWVLKIKKENHRQGEQKASRS